MTKVNWNVDVAHSSVDFSVRHMMISKVKGSFTDFTAQIAADVQDLTTADISFEVKIASVDTRNDERDAHLRSGDFFDAEVYPTMNFQATKIVKTDDDEYDITGDLTIHGITKPVTFAVEYEGQGQDPWGNTKVGFSAEGKIKRSDFDLTWNAALETGGVLVGDEVKISLEIQAIQA